MARCGSHRRDESAAA